MKTQFCYTVYNGIMFLSFNFFSHPLSKKWKHNFGVLYNEIVFLLFNFFFTPSINNENTISLHTCMTKSCLCYFVLFSSPIQTTKTRFCYVSVIRKKFEIQLKDSHVVSVINKYGVHCVFLFYYDLFFFLFSRFPT